MKTILTCILATSSVMIFSCHHKTADAAAEKSSYEQTKETLEEKEKKDPVSFLTVSDHEKHNLIRQMVIKGSITNHARICTYKDVSLELSFFSKTGTLLEKDNETVYDEVAPGNSVDFKTKYYAPKGTDSVDIKVLDAKAK